MCRADGKSQVRQCLDFCRAYFWSTLAYEKTVPNLRLPISSDDVYVYMYQSRELLLTYDGKYDDALEVNDTVRFVKGRAFVFQVPCCPDDNAQSLVTPTVTWSHPPSSGHTYHYHPVVIMRHATRKAVFQHVIAGAIFFALGHFYAKRFGETGGKSVKIGLP